MPIGAEDVFEGVVDLVNNLQGGMSEVEALGKFNATGAEKVNSVRLAKDGSITFDQSEDGSLKGYGFNKTLQNS